MTCSNCGTVAAAGDNFCPRCGTPLSATQTASSTSVAGHSQWARPPAGGQGQAAAPPEYGQVAPAPGRSEYIYGGPTAGDALASAPTTVNPISGVGVTPPATPGSGWQPPPSAWQPPPAELTPVLRTNNRKWGILAVGGAVLLLAIAVLGVWWAGTTARSGPGAAPTQVAGVPTSTTPVATAEVGGYKPVTDEERAIIAAVEANNAAQVIALRTLNPQALDGKMTGAALSDNLRYIESLRQKSLYEEAQLRNIDYEQPRLLTSDQASIRTVEVWDSTLRRRNGGQVVEQRDPQTLHEVYYLTRQNGKWIVTQVDIKEAGVPTPGSGDQN
ncbi:MAG TPA: zinc ribbon domain-containing protein [Chloroflexia bacterium]|nr:zinc ribbon domain-containing protein [Chloroflexia bacterium]